MSRWNGNRFSIYDSEEKSVLKLIKKLGEQVNYNTEELNNKTDLHGDHKGSWQGISRPEYSEPGIAGVVARNTDWLKQMYSLEYAYDVKDTEHKQGDRVDIEKLKMTQTKNLSNLYHNLRTKKAPVKFCHRGDSLTFGYDSTSTRVTSYTWANGETYTYNQALKTYPEAMEEMLRKVYGNDMIKNHINRGKGGDYAKGSLIRHNGKHDADCTLLMLGTNDSRNNGCSYVGNIKEYIYWVEQVIIQELSWDKCIILLSPPITKLQSDYNVDSFANALKYLARKWNIPFIDTQELLIGYDEHLWSDPTHLSTFGYSVLGTKISACFIGEGLLNKNNVISGCQFEASLMTSSSCYTNGDVTYSHSTGCDTPPHNTLNGKLASYLYLFQNSNGKLWISLYCEQDNLLFIPSGYVKANNQVRIVLDNDLNAPDNILDSSYFKMYSTINNNKSSYTYGSDSAFRFNKLYHYDNGLMPLRLYGRGWHIIEIQAIGEDSALCNIQGYEIISYDEMFSHIKNKSIHLYTAMANEGGLQRPIVGETITINNDITKLYKLDVTTGAYATQEYVTFSQNGFNGGTFRVNDYINILTKGLTWITLQIINENTLKYISIDDHYPIRDIFGYVK